MNSKEPQNNSWQGQNINDGYSYGDQESLDYIELYRSVYQETTAAICVVEVKGKGEYLYLDFNPACELWLGTKTENLRGKSPQEIFASQDFQLVIETYNSCVQTQEVRSYEYCIFLANQRSCWITVVNPLISNQGNVYRLISTSINLQQQQKIAEIEQQAVQLRSTLKQLQQALKAEELTSSITQAIRNSLDEKQVLQTATKSLTEGLNLECCQIELYRQEKTKTEVICEYPIVLPDEQGISRKTTDFPELYDRLLDKQSIHFVDWLPTIGYRQQQVTRLICPIFDERDIFGNLWLMRPKEGVFEVEEIKLVEQIADRCAIAIRQARLYKAEQMQVRELEKLNVVKDDFLKTISHELRTPMSGLRLAISTLENLLEIELGANRSTKIDKVLKIFHSSFKKQNQLVDDLLTLCYVDAASKPESWENIDLKTWIPQIVKPFSLGNKQQELKLDLPKKLFILRSDPKMLKRVINELLNNAYKYTPPEGSIIICGEQQSQELLLKVINTGVEIPLEEQERIFDKFYRIPNSDPWQHGGTGIGLALVKKLVELLEGDITVSSKNNTTTFTVSFRLSELLSTQQKK